MLAEENAPDEGVSEPAIAVEDEKPEEGGYAVASFDETDRIDEIDNSVNKSESPEASVRIEYAAGEKPEVDPASITSSRPGDLDYHPHANAFPLIAGIEFEALCEDIEANGQREPIVLFEGKILDGRNRYRALKAIGVEPVFEQYLGDRPLEFVLSMNMYRRQLTVAQRAMIAAEIMCRPLAATDEGEGESEGHETTGSQAGLSLAKAATLMGISERSISSATRVAKSGVDALLNAVKTGEVKISAAEYIAKLDKDEQAEVCAGGAKAVVSKARQMRKERSRATKDTEGENIPQEAPGDIFEDSPQHTEEHALGEMNVFTGPQMDTVQALYQFGKATRTKTRNPDHAADMIFKLLEKAGAEETEAIIFATDVANRVRERMVQQEIIKNTTLI